MTWQQLTLTLTAEQAEIASQVLEAADAVSVTLQDAAGETIIETHWEIHRQPTLQWSKVRLTALLAGDADVDAVCAHLGQELGMDRLPDARVERVVDQDWAEAWKTHYKPLFMGGGLWICPSWCELPDPAAVNVVLDPGMAFGTGDHPTTALCLEWLAQQDLQRKIILDYGCGSGILAIAALKLGAREAYAVDIDPQALAVARENAGRNDVAARLHILPPEALPAALRADTIAANILANALKALAPTLAAHAAPGSGIVLSGLLTEQGDEVRSHYAPAFTLSRRERQGWIALHGVRA